MKNNQINNFLKEQYHINKKDIDGYTLLLNKLLSLSLNKDIDKKIQLQAISLLLKEKKDYLQLDHEDLDNDLYKGISIK